MSAQENQYPNVLEVHQVNDQAACLPKEILICDFWPLNNPKQCITL